MNCVVALQGSSLAPCMACWERCPIPAVVGMGLFLLGSNSNGGRAKHQLEHVFVVHIDLAEARVFNLVN